MRPGEWLGHRAGGPCRLWLEMPCQPLEPVPGPAGVAHTWRCRPCPVVPRRVQGHSGPLPKQRSRARAFGEGESRARGSPAPHRSRPTGRGASLVPAGLEAAFMRHLQDGQEWPCGGLGAGGHPAPGRSQPWAWPPGLSSAFLGKPSQTRLGSPNQPPPRLHRRAMGCPLGLKGPGKPGGLCSPGPRARGWRQSQSWSSGASCCRAEGRLEESPSDWLRGACPGQVLPAPRVLGGQQERAGPGAQTPQPETTWRGSPGPGGV